MIRIYIYIEEKTPPKPCNCREPNKCPLKGECLVKEVVYQATVITAESTETYVGLTATEFKTRWRNHQMSFKPENKKMTSQLSKHLWQLKDQKKDFTISWKIPSSETQGQLVGTTGFSWAKVYNKSGRAPGHLLLPNEFQKRLKSRLLIGQKNFFWPTSEEEQPGDSHVFLHEVVFLINRRSSVARSTGTFLRRASEKK